jgi:disulfide bond formation protein DsbB
MQSSVLTNLLSKTRAIDLLIAATCFALLIAAIIMEYQFNMEPCKLCIFQRIAFVLIAVTALISAIHNSQKIGRKIYGILIFISAALGAALSMRHIYLQNLPKDQVPDCGPALDYMMQILPIGQVIRDVLQGSGDCAEVSWQFLSLTIPEWTLLAFVGLGLLGLISHWIKPKILQQ